jgi:hypothetical protein
MRPTLEDVFVDIALGAGPGAGREALLASIRGGQGGD